MDPRIVRGAGVYFTAILNAKDRFGFVSEPVASLFLVRIGLEHNQIASPGLHKHRFQGRDLGGSPIGENKTSPSNLKRKIAFDRTLDHFFRAYCAIRYNIIAIVYQPAL